jgi:hypothetical protein
VAGREVKHQVKKHLRNLTKLHKSEALKRSRFSRANLIIFAIVFSSIGGFLIFRSFAAGPTASIEAENGTVTAPALAVNDSNASGGKAVKFHAGTTGACATPTHNVPDGPDPWGGCFPGPNNTGVPAGTTLTNWTGGCAITTNDLIIDSKTINCPGGMSIQATNVTIKNSKVSEYIYLDTDVNSNWSLTLQDTEVYGGHYDLPVIGNGNITMLRVKAHGGHNGLQCDEHSLKGCTMTDSYIYGQEIVNQTDPHLGGLLTDGGPVGMTLTHNSVTCDATFGCTGDINLIPNFATVQYVTLSNNLFGASDYGSYCTYGGEKPPSPFPHANHVVYQNNIFQRGTSNLCATYGPVGDFDIAQPGNVWTNNKYADGAAILCNTTNDCL